MQLTKKKYPNKAHWKGRKHTEESKAKMRANSKSWNKGMKMPLEYRLKLSEARKGEKHPNWQGGKSNINKRIRNSIEYKLWRESIFVRDNYTCVWCGDGNFKGRGKTIKLNADHIKPFCDYPELRFSIDNGRTLCEECHKKTDTYAGKSGLGKKHKKLCN